MSLDFAVFIISHQRSNRVETYNMLRDSGYTGKIFIVLDDEDSEYGLYRSRFGGDVITYCKSLYRDITEVCTRVKGCATYARNAVEDIAQSMSLKCFMVADDDLLRLRYRYDDNGILRSVSIKSNLDHILNEYTTFMINGDVACTSFGTANIYMKGISADAVSSNRIPFNCFIRNAKYKWTWKSDIYEDAITAILESNNGDFAMQLPFVQCDMCPMDAGAKGGMTGVYTSISNYEKNFPVIVYAPSCIKLGAGKKSFNYSTLNNHAFPKLISSKHKLL